jgi:hypothetical protein
MLFDGFIDCSVWMSRWQWIDKKVRESFALRGMQ